MSTTKLSPCYLYQPNAKLGAAANNARTPKKKNFFATATDEQIKDAGFTIEYLPPADPWEMKAIHGTWLLWAEGLTEDGYQQPILPDYLADQPEETQAFYQAIEGGLSPDEIYQHGDADGWDEAAEASLQLTEEAELWDQLAQLAQEDPEMKELYQESLN